MCIAGGVVCIIFDIRLQVSRDDPKQSLWARSLHTLPPSWFFFSPTTSWVECNAICNASSEFLQEAQKDSSSTSTPAWPASGNALIGKHSSDFPHSAFRGISISHMPRFRGPLTLHLLSGNLSLARHAARSHAYVIDPRPPSPPPPAWFMRICCTVGEEAVLIGHGLRD